ncbi:hypothetical protein J14TS2_54340 [Bacillus sp. J14TS2]|nr:hypothetical protein J14TS2_54340 [Bacillus sp. J14TS2]
MQTESKAGMIKRYEIPISRLGQRVTKWSEQQIPSSHTSTTF